MRIEVDHAARVQRSERQLDPHATFLSPHHAHVVRAAQVSLHAAQETVNATRLLRRRCAVQLEVPIAWQLVRAQRSHQLPDTLGDLIHAPNVAGPLER